ncbi:Glycerol kinase, partial [Mycoplasmopsis edwardii]
MKDKYVITLDSGTTSCRTLVVNHAGEIVASSQTEFTQHFPKSGW